MLHNTPAELFRESNRINVLADYLPIAKVGNCFKVTIPSEMIQDLNWKEGDILRVGMDERKISIRKDTGLE